MCFSLYPQRLNISLSLARASASGLSKSTSPAGEISIDLTVSIRRWLSTSNVEMVSI